MSLVIISGRLGKDAVVETTQTGTKVVKFNIAENDFRNGEDITTWYDAVSFNTFIIDKQIKVLKKGAFIIAVGDLTVRPSFSKTGQLFLNYDVLVNSIKLVSNTTGKKSENSEDTTEVTTGTVERTPTEDPADQTPSKPKAESEPTSYVDEGKDDELPF